MLSEQTTVILRRGHHALIRVATVEDNGTRRTRFELRDESKATAVKTTLQKGRRAIESIGQVALDFTARDLTPVSCEACDGRGAFFERADRPYTETRQCEDCEGSGVKGYVA